MRKKGADKQREFFSVLNNNVTNALPWRICSLWVKTNWEVGYAGLESEIQFTAGWDARLNQTDQPQRWIRSLSNAAEKSGGGRAVLHVELF